MFIIPKNINAFLEATISTFEGSTERAMMDTGKDYYKSENTKIMARKKLMYVRDSDSGADYLIEDPYKANNKLASGFYKILVDQKVQYSLGKAVTVQAKNTETDILDFLGKDFPRILQKTGKAASKKYIGWVQVYIQDGEFKLMAIPPEQIIDVYKTENADELDYILRYYPVQALNDQDEMETINRVEIWDEHQVVYYQQKPETKEYVLYIFPDGSQNPRPHMKSTVTHGEKVTSEQGLSWGRVPFIPFYNNDEDLYDLQAIKHYVDAYDIVGSDFANNLEDIQDVYWILKGYDGENIDTFLAEVRKYKTLKVSEDGDAKAHSIEIPTEARKVALERLMDDIFRFARGVDTSKPGEGNLTNVVIKARFANLDLKASEFEAQCREFIDGIMWFLNRYFEITNQEQIQDYKITFNRSQIFNETELLKSNTEQQGSISEDTRLSNHPWVEDVEDEKKKMEAEKPAIIIPEPEDEEDGDDEEEGQEAPDTE